LRRSFSSGAVSSSSVLSKRQIPTIGAKGVTPKDVVEAALPPIAPLLQMKILPSKDALQKRLAEVKAVSKNMNLEDDPLAEPELQSIMNSALNNAQRVASYDPIDAMRDHLNLPIPAPQPGEVPSPAFFAEMLRVAEENNLKWLEAQTLLVFKELEKITLYLRKRDEERVHTDVNILGAVVPKEVAESVPMQLYVQSVNHLREHFSEVEKRIKQDLKDLDAFIADLSTERDNLKQMTVADVARKHPEQLAEALKAQAEHRWFERAIEGEDDSAEETRSHDHKQH